MSEGFFGRMQRIFWEIYNYERTILTGRVKVWNNNIVK